jgi:hypothetical protein
VRFRVGADNNTGGPGWDIDDIEISGIDNTPFTSLVAEPTICGKAGPDVPGADAGAGGTGNGAVGADGKPTRADGGADGGGCATSPRGSGFGFVGLMGGLASLLAVVRRRRAR